jgi:hypothetical protein
MDQYIRKYLASMGISIKHEGYRILLKVIIVSVEHPDYNCQQLFLEVSPEWHSPYRAVRYSLIQAGITSSVYTFVLSAAEETRCACIG